MHAVAVVARRACHTSVLKGAATRSVQTLAETGNAAGGKLADLGPTTSKLPKAKGRVRQVKLFEDLPSQRLDSNGDIAAPLPAWAPDPEGVKSVATPKRTVRRKKKSDAEPGDSKDLASDALTDGPEVPLLHELGAEGQAWPPLAKEVLTNMARFPGCVLLTRVGGFYESYFSQAPELASLLSIKLASRTWGGRTVGMAGFPLSQLEKYLKVLVQDCGKLVAICEEFREFAHSAGSLDAQRDLEEDDPKIRRTFNEGVTIKRRVTRVVTPGTLIDEKFLDPFSNNFILSVSSLPASESLEASVTETAQRIYGLAWLDVSTADFNTTICTDAVSLRDEVARIAPREIILQAGSFTDETGNASDQKASSNTTTGHPLWEALDAKSVMVTYTTDDMMGGGALLDSSPFQLNLSGMTAAENRAVSYLTSYLQDRLLNMASSALSNSTPLRRDRSQVMHIDAHTMSALEIKESIREGGVRGSLASIVRRTLTRGGTRLLGEWLTSPSTNLETITSRQTLVELFLNNSFLRDDLRLHLRRGAGDVSRVLQKIVTARNDEQDLLEVRDFIETCDAIVARLQAEKKSLPVASTQQAGADSLEASEEFALHRLADSFQALTTLGSELADAIDAGVMEKRLRAQAEMVRRMESEAAGKEGIYTENDQNTGDKAPVRKSKKGTGESSTEDDGLWGQPLEHLIRPSSSQDLQALTKEHMSLRKQAKKLELMLKEHFTERVTLKFLLGQGYVVHFPDFKEKFNEIIEEHMTPAQRNKTTRTFYHRKWSVIGNRLQRLADQLREKEALELERLRQNVMLALSALRHNARLVDQLDVLLGFSQLAQELNLIRPIVDESRDIEIRDGRHLSVEVGLLESQAAKATAEEARSLINEQSTLAKVVPPPPSPALQQRSFVENDLSMHADTDTLHLITGPNMGGKSTFLRQNALMAILAQCGSFVPASYARLGIVDRIFSRVGAKDDLFRDRSTFMVEMLETAEILARATSRSLVIADEIGRGTTSEVGLAVAYATAHQLYSIGCRALFASHFHEVADMLSYSEAVDGAGGAGRRNGDRFAKIRFFCTDVEESSTGSISYSHRLRPGINRDSHGLKVARIAGMPPRAVHVAEAALQWIQGPSGWSRGAAEARMHDQLELLDRATDN
ncbi:unnamed protein product [Tilletia laevis]|uniref:DNA mismatch repair protein n=2 Tax=Tilletia TaxID=13289 RepID=A0A177VI05_9BASI|nr:hypothetical protein CF336_g858 [Tilletia laevis]KAE8264918.1 hypothetical protein A4X03_0g603 [Tilletia caries]CAD6912896.1 unnamed protein product [Tilletia controversa]KAE8208290.1 hypothetical protein CF335_g515 [Tilletia laevis]CAD6891453.1 unnamed protein product [Tilletia caries]